MEKKLELKYSPEQIVGVAHNEGVNCVSHEAIYRKIWYDKHQGGNLYEDLRHRAKRYRKRGAAKERRGKSTNRQDIDLRTSVAAAIAIVQVVFGSVWACTCAPASPPLKALAKADAVFSGKVESITKREVELDDCRKIVVGQSWKGNITGTVKVHTGGGGGDCGFPFEKGKSYLIYAMRDDKSNLTTNICMRTRFLGDTATEILELEGRLPEPKGPPAPPTFRLIGKINDAGYEGLIFMLHNRLHGRVFLFRGSSNTHCVQVYENNLWVDYAPNCGVSSRKELSREEASKMFERWRFSYEGKETKRSATYLDRLSTTRNFIAVPTSRKTWRVGLQYITESEFGDGKKIQLSKRYIWSEAIVPTQLDLPMLTFDQAFEQKTELQR